MSAQAISLSQLNRYIAGFLTRPELINVWVVAELMDVRLSRGHCYMELVEKTPGTGAVTARMRAAIWASNYPKIATRFAAATGTQLASGQKVMLCGSVGYHAAYGLSFVVNDIDPAYTMGEAERRRREILARLKADGIMDDNRKLQWPSTALRIAVISAPGAAGYGDFINQLYTSPSRLRFAVRLFPAVMQGDRTVSSVITALDDIAAESDRWDCVVIIRGGGASSELQAFDDYDLAANVAQFPLPVIVGIGHERDITVLDYVANLRVKTPTAAAEWLIARGEAALDEVRSLAEAILRTATERISGARTQLAHLESALGIAPQATIQRADSRLRQAAVTLGSIGARRITPELARLDHTIRAIATAGKTAIQRRADRLDSYSSLLAALSPEATLRRGYSLTLLNGKAVRDASSLPEGTTVTTRLARGQFQSTVTSTSNDENS